MVAYLDSEYPGRLDTTNYLSKYVSIVLANCTKAIRQELETERVQRARDFRNKELTRIASIDCY